VPGIEIGEQFRQQIGPSAAVPQMMMCVDDCQFGFEDRLLLLFCEPSIVGLAAMTKPAWLNGLRHGKFPILPILPAFRSRHGYHLAFVVSSKVLTRDSRVQAALSRCPAGRQRKVRGGIQTPSSHPAEGETGSSNPFPSSSEPSRIVIACVQPMARPKVADAGEDRVGHWIDERIDLAHIYAQIWKAAAGSPHRCCGVVRQRRHAHRGPRRSSPGSGNISVRHWFTGRTIRLFSPSNS